MIRPKHRSRVALQSFSKQALFEPLENRQLLSCVIDLRTSTGGKTASVSAVGQTVNLQLWAVVTGKNSTGADEAFQTVIGSFLSAATKTGAVAGNLSASLMSDYTAISSSAGTKQDLNGDGSIDVGSNDNSSANSNYFIARGDKLETDGTVSGASQSFEVATVRYTVTSLNSGNSTDVNFRLAGFSPGNYIALWREDGSGGANNQNSTLSLGSPVVIIGPNGTTGTGSTAVISGSVLKAGTTTGISGVSVYIDKNNNGKLDTGDTSTTTSSTGTYSFTSLASGSYIVREVVPSGYTQTSPASGISITLASGATASGQNFTDSVVVANPGTISGSVLKSGTSTGIGSVVVYIDKNNNGTLDSGDISTSTASSGAYTFANIAAGNYVVRQQVPSGYTQSSPSGSAGISVALGAGKTVSGQNFSDTAVVSTNNAAISGVIFKDTNLNGMHDSGEPYFSNVELYLDLKKDGKIDSGDPTVFSSSSGGYQFTGLAAGTYRVREVIPSGYRVTNPSSGYTDVTVASSASSGSHNWGNTATALVSGNLFNDANGNGKQDAGEGSISGWKVYIDTNNDGKFESTEPSTTTSSSGAFSFNGLAAGTYYVRFVPASGYKISTPSSGYFKLTLTAGQISTLVVGAKKG